nr:Antibiotic efflux protein [Kibdelosporangium sp. MJ126-NF4]CTQ99023.1 Antibiotic efflux protein [Kibdelosporangium sp. MJ126-NF4]
MLSPTFWRFCCAAVAAGTGDGVRLGLFPVLAASLGAGPGQVATVVLAGTLPWLLLGPVAGVLTDRWDRRRILWISDTVRATVMLTFAVIVAVGHNSVVMLAVVNFLLGSAQSLRDTATFAIVPHIVTTSSLERANGWLQSSILVTEELLGPPVGVVLLGLLPVLPLVVGGLSFAVAGWLVLGMVVEFARPRTDPVPAGCRGLLADIVEGARWLLRHRLLRAACVLVCLTNLAATSVAAIAVLYAYQVLHVSTTTYALLLGVIALGGILGPVASAALVERFGRGLTLQITFLFTPVAFVVTGLTSSPLVAAIAFAMVGASVGICVVITGSLRQILVPDGMLGRVSAAYRLVAFGVAPLGAGAGGVIAAHFGLRAPFFVGAAVITCAGVTAVLGMSNRVVESYIAVR